MKALLEKEFLEIVHPDFRAWAIEGLRLVEEKSATTSPREIKMIRFDGTAVHVEAVGTLIALQGKPATQIIAKDITERKRFEEALSNSERLYRLMFESNPHPMWIYDTDTLSFLFVNDAAVVHYGYYQGGVPFDDAAGHPAGRGAARSVRQRLQDRIRTARFRRLETPEKGRNNH